MLNNAFLKVINNINRIRNSTFTQQEIDNLINELQVIFVESDFPYPYIKSLLKDIKTKLSNIVGKDINKKAIIKQILMSYVDTTFSNMDEKGIVIKRNDITTIAVYGTHGVGKTTFVVKLANMLKKQYKKNILCISFDNTRASAQEQLKISCQKNDIEFFDILNNGVDIGIKKMKEIVDRKVVDILIVDNAGSYPDVIDGFDNISKVKNAIQFDERILVIDGISNQSSSNIITRFDEKLNLTGFVVSKADANQYGGVFFAIRMATDKPIYYISNGEKISDIIIFSKQFVINSFFSNDLKTIQNQLECKKNIYGKCKDIQKFNYNDLLEQLVELINFGKLDKILSILPHTRSFFNIKLSTDAYGLIKKWIAIINSMTAFERKNPSCINIDRINRIANGSGNSINDVITLQNKLKEIIQK